MRILVLDGHENQAVACVRSLARAGHHVVVGAETRWSKAGWSRDCAGTFRYPRPQHDAAAFVEAVAREAAREPGTLVLPMTEATTLPLSRERPIVEAAGGSMVLPPHDVVLRAFDKSATTELARSLGIDVPRTAMISSLAEARDHSTALRYPVVLKPRSSQECGANGAVRTTGGPMYARAPDELLCAWRAISQRCASALAQEYVEGAGVGYFALMRHGQLRAEFAHRRLRDVRPTGSGSALRISTAVDPHVRAHALAILEALGWHGVAMVEFRVRPDGTPVFLEVNGRFWSSLALAVHAGVDFPARLAQMAAHGDVEPVASFREGVRCRWIVGDVRHLIAVWRGAPDGYPSRFPGRLATLASVLTPMRGTFHDNFTWRDPLPELGDWLGLLRKAAAQAVGRQAASSAYDPLYAKGRASHP